MRFTQFLFPDGRQKPITIDGLDPAVEVLADQLERGGCAFEIECFPDTQLVSAEIRLDEETLAMECVPNGLEVPPAIEKLARDAHAMWLSLGFKPEVDQ